MIKIKLPILLIWGFLFVGLYGTKNNRDGFCKALRTSVVKRKNLTTFQERQQRCWLCVIRHKSSVKSDDEENHLVSDNLCITMIQDEDWAGDNEELDEKTIAYLKEPCKDPTAINTDKCSICCCCTEEFEKIKLTSFWHQDGRNTNGDQHFALCYECDKISNDVMNSRGDCPICRKLLRRPTIQCQVILDLYKLDDNNMRLVKRKYDDNSLAFWVTSGGMFALSYYLTETFKGMGLMRQFNGEGETEFHNEFTAFTWQQLARNIYGYYFVVSTKFIWDTKSAQSLIMDKKALSYLGVLFSTGVLTAAGMGDYASAISVGALLPYCLDMFFLGGRYIVSKRFKHYTGMFPTIPYTRFEPYKEWKGKWKILDMLLTLYMGGTFLSGIACIINTWAGHPSSIVISLLDAFLNSPDPDDPNDPDSHSTHFHVPANSKIVKIQSVLNFVFALILNFQKLRSEFKGNRSILTWEKMSIWFFAGFAIMHSSGMLNLFIFLNMLLFMLLLCSYGYGQPIY